MEQWPLQSIEIEQKYLFKTQPIFYWNFFKHSQTISLVKYFCLGVNLLIFFKTLFRSQPININKHLLDHNLYIFFKKIIPEYKIVH